MQAQDRGALLRRHGTAPRPHDRPPLPRRRSARPGAKEGAGLVESQRAGVGSIRSGVQIPRARGHSARSAAQRLESVQTFYAQRAAAGNAVGAKTGVVTVVQRTSSDLKRSPHLHSVFLDGAYHEEGAELVWEELGHLKTREVGEVLEQAVRRMTKHLRRRGVLETHDSDDESAQPEDKLAASAGV
jgi:hypothetical protein